MILFFIFSASASAATITVTNLEDNGPGSLRQAIITANANPGDDTIQFQSGLSGTITLGGGEITISKPSSGLLTISGPGANVLAISGNNFSRILKINSGKVTLNGLTLKDGKSSLSSSGGGIYNTGTLTISNSTLSGNSASYGGGIYNSSYHNLTISNSTLSGNSASSGGGIYNNTGTLTISNSTLSGNSASSYGGGIYNTGTLTMSNSTLSGNSAPNGGGIHSYDTGTVTVTNSVLFGNSASLIGGGIYNDGLLTVSNSTLSGNTASTTSSNFASGGGIYINSYGTVTLNNTTLSGNTAKTYGGGVYNNGKTFTVGNSLVAGNVASTGKEIYGNTAGSFTSLGYNLFGENGDSGFSQYAVPTSRDLILPGSISTAVGPLANNGGPTQTHLPVGGSLAINRGSNALVPTGVTTDQRGYGPRIVGGTVDIGAVETGAVTSFTVTVTKTGTGSGVVSGSGSYAAGATVNLTATANTGSTFVGWSPSPCAASFTMPASNLTCTATFNTSSQITGSAVGVFRNGTWYLDANANGAWDGCGTEFCFSGFGQAGDMPASGNWSGGSKSYIGVLRSGTGEWFIDRNGNRQWDGCAVDGCYSGFGAPGDLPVAGDWNGTGFAKIGVFRNGQWFLDNGNGAWDGCGTELCLSFGQAGDLPAAGNWDGGLKAGAGVFRAGTWYLDYNGNGAWDGCGIDRCYFGSFGQAGDLPAAGDWNGDGKAKVGVFRNGTWYLDYNGNGAWDGCGVDRCYFGSFGQAGDLPVAGKW